MISARHRVIPDLTPSPAGLAGTAPDPGDGPISVRADVLESGSRKEPGNATVAGPDTAPGHETAAGPGAALGHVTAPGSGTAPGYPTAPAAAPPPDYAPPPDSGPQPGDPVAPVYGPPPGPGPPPGRGYAQPGPGRHVPGPPGPEAMANLAGDCGRVHSAGDRDRRHQRLHTQQVEGLDAHRAADHRGHEPGRPHCRPAGVRRPGRQVQVQRDQPAEIRHPEVEPSAGFTRSGPVRPWGSSASTARSTCG